MAVLLSLVCALLATGHRVRCETLPQTGKPCGDYWDGTWVAVKPKALEGPAPALQGRRVISKANGPKFLQASLGDWTYQVLDVVMKNASAKGLEVYVGRGWVPALPFLKNGTLSVDNLMDVCSLYGKGADVSDAEYAYRVRRLKPASGKYMIFVRNSGKAPVWVEDVMVCARQIDFSSDGVPMTPRGVSLLASLEWRSQSSKYLNGQFSRLNTPTLRAGGKCDGYDASCPDGKTCTGTYRPTNCDISCDLIFAGTSMCAPGDIEVGRKSDCGKGDPVAAFFTFGFRGQCPSVVRIHTYIHTCGIYFRTSILGASFWLP